jgi:chromosomal replication initiator protein
MLTNQLWETVLGELELTISKANFTTWFKNTFIYSLDGESVVIGVPNAFTKAWLENKYHSYILTALNKSSQGKIANIIYKVASPKEAPVKPLASIQGALAETAPAAPTANE